MNMELETAKYWDEVYNRKNDKWTLNSPNPVLVDLVEEKMMTRGSSILVIGAGKGEDAIYLASEGFKVTAVDFSDYAVKSLSEMVKIRKVKMEIICRNIFSLFESGMEDFDYVYEYTTFCALNPKKIGEAIRNIHHVLKEEGCLISVLFPIDGREGGPPFNINIEKFYEISSNYFNLELFRKKIPSINPRLGSEALLVLRKLT